MVWGLGFRLYIGIARAKVRREVRRAEQAKQKAEIAVHDLQKCQEKLLI